MNSENTKRNFIFLFQHKKTLQQLHDLQLKEKEEETKRNEIEAEVFLI